MAKNIKPLIGTTNSFSVGSGSTNVVGATIKNDNPPSEQNVAAIYIHNGGGVASVTITVQCQFYSGVDWGPLHTVQDDDGADLTFDASVDTDVEANMYAQPFWKENDGWRIVLLRPSPCALIGTAVAVIR